jgi:uncharacterized membrane protein
MEDDAPPKSVKDSEQERSVLRIFSLTDGVFAIAMTLLVLDLKVPSVGDHPADSVLRDRLWDQNSAYLAFLLSFYVIATYWRRHHRLMRTVRSSDPALLSRNILLLLAISVMPFAAELLGTYGGSDPIAITVYALVNALAGAALLLIDHELAARHLSSDGKSSGMADGLWCDVGAFLLAGPVAYALPKYGLLGMVVLIVLSGAAARLMDKRQTRRRAALLTSADQLPGRGPDGGSSRP